ncbi:MAG: hypothetical protein OHK0038_04390 [Flammeovirgaceae bacterium]
MKRYLLIVITFAAFFVGFKALSQKEDESDKPLRIFSMGKEVDITKGINSDNVKHFEIKLNENQMPEELHISLGYVLDRRASLQSTQGKRLVFSQIIKGIQLKQDFKFHLQDFLEKTVVEEDKSYFLAFEAKYSDEKERELIGIMPLE